MASRCAGSVFSASRGDMLKKRVSKRPGSSMKQPNLTRLVFFFLPVGSKCVFQSKRSGGISRCTSRPALSNSQNASLEADDGKRPE